MHKYFTGNTEVNWDKTLRKTYDNQGINEHRVEVHNRRFGLMGPDGINKSHVRAFPFNFVPMGGAHRCFPRASSLTSATPWVVGACCMWRSNELMHPSPAPCLEYCSHHQQALQRQAGPWRRERRIDETSADAVACRVFYRDLHPHVARRRHRQAAASRMTRICAHRACFLWNIKRNKHRIWTTSSYARCLTPRPNARASQPRWGERIRRRAREACASRPD